jgi:hypothetical protein
VLGSKAGKAGSGSVMVVTGPAPALALLDRRWGMGRRRRGWGRGGEERGGLGLGQDYTGGPRPMANTAYTKGNIEIHSLTLSIN